MLKNNKTIVLLFFFLLWQGHLWSEDAWQRDMLAAQEAMKTEDYRSALNLYRQWEHKKQVFPGEYYFNWGLAAYHSELWPEALWAFLSAKHSLGDSDPLDNLILLTEAQMPIGYSNGNSIKWSSHLFWKYYLPPWGWFILSLTFLSLFCWALLILSKVKGRVTPVTWFFFLFTILGLMTFIPDDWPNQEPLGILMTEAPVYQDNPMGHTNDRIATISPGIPLVVLEKRSDWIKIEWDGENQGWIPHTSIKIVEE